MGGAGPFTGTGESVLYSKAITGGDMGTTGFLELLLYGRLLHNTTDVVHWIIKFGGTTWMRNEESATPLPAGASEVPFELRVFIVNYTISTQAMWTTLQVFNGAQPQGAAGYGNFNGHSTSILGGLMAQPSGTINTALNQTLEVAIAFQTASASNSMQRSFARLLLGKN